MVRTRIGKDSIKRVGKESIGKKQLFGIKKIISEVNHHGVKIIKGKSSGVDGSAGDPSSTTKPLNLREHMLPFPQVEATVLPHFVPASRDVPRDM